MVKPSPLLGQHVDDVLGSWLGMDANEVAALRQDGVVGSRTDHKSVPPETSTGREKISV